MRDETMSKQAASLLAATQAIGLMFGTEVSFKKLRDQLAEPSWENVWREIIIHVMLGGFEENGGVETTHSDSPSSVLYDKLISENPSVGTIREVESDEDQGCDCTIREVVLNHSECMALLESWGEYEKARELSEYRPEYRPIFLGHFEVKIIRNYFEMFPFQSASKSTFRDFAREMYATRESADDEVTKVDDLAADTLLGYLERLNIL